METIRFNEATNPHECIDVVKNTGAILVREYIEDKLSRRILEEIDWDESRFIYSPNGKVKEEVGQISYTPLSKAPESVTHLGNRLGSWLFDVTDFWPNEADVQRYYPGQAAVGRHRDYLRDILLINIGSLLGEATFRVELDTDTGDKQWSESRVEPGDLAILRAPGLTGSEVDDRPYHSIEPPESGERVSVIYRHNVRLENKNMEDTNGNS